MVTLNEMREYIDGLIKEGYGDRTVYLSKDDEWNDAHKFFGEYAVDVDDIMDIMGYRVDDAEKVIIIG